VTGCTIQPVVRAPAVDASSISARINQQLNLHETLVKVDAVERILPEDVDPVQVGSYFQLGTLLFALVRNHSINVPLQLPQDFTHAFTGILVSDDGATWQKYLGIKDRELTAKNNPYYLWTEGDVLFLSIVDQLGAGSGEGVMKLAQLAANGEWVIVNCVYFGQQYSGPETDGDYFAYSRMSEKWSAHPGEECENVELIYFP
jgi:hypothetical protein